MFFFFVFLCGEEMFLRIPIPAAVFSRAPFSLSLSAAVLCRGSASVRLV